MFGAMAVLLVALLWGVDPGRALAELAEVRLGWLVLFLVAATLHLLVRTVRLAAIVPAPVGAAMLSVMAVGFLAILLTPLRLGELVRPYLLFERHRVPWGASLGAVFAERVLEVLALYAVLLVVVLTVSLPGGALVVGEVDLLEVGQRTLTGSLVVGGAVMAGVVIAGSRLSEFLERVGLESVAGFAAEVARAWRALFAEPWRGLVAAGTTVLAWGIAIAGHLCLLKSFPGITANRDTVLASFAGSQLGQTFVPTPGALGGWEAGCAAALALFGEDLDRARVFAVYAHGVSLGHTLFIGLLFLVYEGGSLAGLVRASRAARGMSE